MNSPRNRARKRVTTLADPLVVVDDSGSNFDPSDSDASPLPAYLSVASVRKYLSNPSLVRVVSGYFLVLLICLLLFGASWKMVWRLPKALPNDSPNHIFAEGRAWEHLERLQQIGPSLVGTKSNVAVSNYIEDAMKSLQAELEAAKKAGLLKLSPKIEIEVQRPSGALNFDLLGFTLTNHYTRLHNVIARVSWEHHFDEKSPRAQKSLLVNSHFDSGVGSPGAMDARACNAVMLELARSLSYAENPLPHPVIFLWNGAEESLQEGSHGFITKHRWRSEVGSVLNFDAGGIGGPQILFQVGSGEYAKLFAKVAPRLHGSILAQELFDTGLLQGDTDYRIFRDFGDVHGLDLAWYRDGYKYHTPRDDLNWVEEGSLQHAGDNSFAYISAICSHEPKGLIWRDDHIQKTASETQQSKSPQPADSGAPLPDLLDAFPSRSQIIFYDYLGLFTVHYSKSMATVLNTVVACCVFFLVFLNRKTLHVSKNRSENNGDFSSFAVAALASLARSTGAIFLANLVGVLFCLLIGVWMTVTGKTMSWFSDQSVIAFLYLPPVVLGWILVQFWRTGKPLSTLLTLNSGSKGVTRKEGGNMESESDGTKVGRARKEAKSWQLLEYETMEGVAMWATGTLVVWSWLGIASAYFWLWLSASSFASLLVIRWNGLDLLKAERMKESAVPAWAYVCYLPAALGLYQTMIQIMALAFPLSGRLPPEVPVELVTSSIFVMLMLNAITPLQPLIHRLRNYRVAIKMVLVLLLIGVVIGMTTFPYSPYRPKRVTIQHGYRTSPMPGHDGLDSPAILFALCDAGPTGNMISVLKQLDSRGASPHRDVHDWDSVFPLSSFLSGYSLPSTAPPLRAPTATVLKDHWDQEKRERKMVIEVDYAGSEWSTLKFMGPLSHWNLTDELPTPSMPSGYHIIRHIGEHGLSKWAVELTFPDNKKRRFDITATHFAPTSATHIVTQTLPDWTAPLVLTTAMSHIDA